ncbi:MAG: twin-arginine translocase TatA/TatE family subunit [Flavobacteriales bacterium]|nr:twin-arginine translocase TatA/TatE family subunit [Flavobacteriales bacterium]
MYFFLLNLGFGEIILIFLVYLIFFGSKNFPVLMRDLGRVFYKIKSSIDDLYKDFNSDYNK